jgi:ribosomal protein S21
MVVKIIFETEGKRKVERPRFDLVGRCRELFKSPKLKRKRQEANYGEEW